jgi:hypothetical protein
MDYITAYNNDNHPLAEELLFKIKQKREENGSDT